MNDTAIAVNRAAPMFHKAAEIYERIQTALSKHKEITADILTAAGECGHALDAAFLSISSSNVVVSESDILASHAPNIPLEKARKLRAFAQGKYSDPRQRWLFELEQETESTRQDKKQRAKAAPWEQSWGYITKLSRIEWTEWPKEQRDMTRDELTACVAKLGGKVEWQ